MWRGQRRSDWPLEPKLDRLIGSGRISSERRHRFASSHLEQFKFAIRGRRGPAPQQLYNENEWWALGQHHGLATPLLDWTASPFVAAYFAYFEEGEKQTRTRAIYAFHRPTAEVRAAQKATTANAARVSELKRVEAGEVTVGLMGKAILKTPIDPDLVFVRPLSDDNQRLVNQGGLFSRTSFGVSVEKWVADNSAEDDPGSTLIRILVPDRDRHLALRMLNRMNINHLSLFPDLSGASTFCNLFAEIDRY